MKSLIPWKNKRDDAAPAIWSDGWFDRFWENPFGLSLFPFSGSRGERLPTVDVSEDKSDVTVRAEVPGLTEKDLDLTWHNGVLTVKMPKTESARRSIDIKVN